ncbi:MAG: DUF177 domain-containing protein [Pseudomonadota bacterium]
MDDAADISARLTALDDWSVRLDHIPRAGRSIAREATASERQVLAREYDIPSVEHVSAELDLKSTTQGCRMTGSVRAKITLTCGVTLEPVQQTIEEDIAVDWLRAPNAIANTQQHGSPNRASDVAFDALDEDDPEPVTNGRLDLGRYVAETIASAIDPFPRAPDATLDQDEAVGPEADDADEPSPFAALAALKREKPGDTDS